MTLGSIGRGGRSCGENLKRYPDPNAITAEDLQARSIDFYTWI